MAILRTPRNLWRTLFRSTRLDNELNDELRAYVEARIDHHLGKGLNPEAARRAAMLDVGGVEQVKEQVRDARVGWGVETTLRDLRHGCRAVRRTPGFAVVVVLTLALGIGANVMMFSVMYGVLWRPLPYPSPDRLVIIAAEIPNLPNAGLAPGEIIDLRSASRSFQMVATFIGVDAYLTHDGHMERLTAASVSDDLLPLLGAAPPVRGRTLDSRRDETSDRVTAIVVSDAFRRRWFPNAAEIVGEVVRINNMDLRIVGVLRPDFRVHLPVAMTAAEEIDVWFPTGISSSRRGRPYLTLARLAPGVSLAAAQAELDALAPEFLRLSGETHSSFRLRVRSVQDVVTADVRRALLALGAAVGFVLLICCVNVANLMVARTHARERELAVRRALGGTRSRLLRQMFTENLVLVLVGGALGLAVAYGGAGIVEWLRPTHLPRQSEIAINGTVAIYALLLVGIVSLVFGLLPAIRGTAAEPCAPLRSCRMATSPAGMRRVQRGLVAAEVALSIVPLVAAGLMLRTFINLNQAPIGFDPSHLLTARISYSFRLFPDIEQRWPLHRDATERVSQIPGIEGVSAVSAIPFAEARRQHLRRYARHDDAAGPQARTTLQTVMPGYLRLVKIALHAGRDFSDEDIAAQRPVVIIDQRLADRLWPGGALGQFLAIDAGSNRTAHLEVIGITNPVRVMRVREEAMPHIFVPYHFYPVEMSLVMKTRESASTLAPAVRQAVESLGTGRPVSDFRFMQDYVDRSIADVRFTMLVLAGFALASLLLAAIGLYGTVAYLSSQRAREFGLRMALGASASRVLRSVAGEGLRLAAIGGAFGFAGAAAVSGLLSGLLYDVEAFDMTTLVSVAGLVTLIALIATTHPAWKASRINPMRVLREAE